ncbi:phospholipase D-like domain-containing protein [Caenibacillus caldisaponilyticus]|uniref:phospholipase D-like domain-containing protein n=1 Tax=Caenibacillus caldisaponilyticus TaxID=1674942 RepID=UPI001EE74EF7|nr:phospholipase D-like domain-containing protein [Caenibacillus caldisaponilyticus]
MDPLVGTGAVLATGAIAVWIAALRKRSKPEKSGSVPISDNTIRSVFTKTGGSPQKTVNAVIDRTTSALDVAMFLMTNEDIVAHLSKAAGRNVKVRLITDREQAESASKQSLNTLAAAGIPIKVNRHDGAMHLKVMIADQKVVTAGSYNFTNKAEKKNDEVLIVIRSRAVAENWSKRFERMWTDNSQYADYHPETLTKKFA